MTKASHVLSSICLLILGMTLYVPAVQGQSAAQQVVEDAADALGGRDRVLAVKTLLVEGEGDYVLDLPHASTMLMVYFPTGRILTDADLYFPDDRRTLTADEPGGHAAFTQNLLSNITYRRLQVDYMMPIHGRFVPYTEFVEAAIRMRSMTSMTPTTN